MEKQLRNLLILQLNVYSEYSAYRRGFDKTEYLSLLIKDD